MTNWKCLRLAALNSSALYIALMPTQAAAETVHRVTQFSYDSMGRVECTAVRMDPAQWGAQTNACVPQTSSANGPDRIVKNVYDLGGQLLQVREGVGTSVEAAEATYGYTIDGKREFVIDGEGNRAQLVYDGYGRLLKWVFPSTTRPSGFDASTPQAAMVTAGLVNASDFEQYGYDQNGNRTSLRKRDASTLTYSYDALNRMTLKVVPERAGLAATATRDVYYEYDLLGMMTKARFDSLAGDGITNVYASTGTLTSSQINQSGLNRTLSYLYDVAGKRTRLTHADGQAFNYVRDALERVTFAYEGTTQVSTAQLLQYSFNNRGLLSSLKRSTGANGFTATYGYDGIGAPTSVANDASGTANDLTITHGLNAAGQIATQTRTNDSYSWSGAAALSRAYATNGLNQYTSAGPASFTYDANGNLTSDGTRTFLFDIENRMVSAPGASPVTLAYDPLGRLFEVSSSSGTTRFLYDGDELVAEYDAAGTLARRYVHSDATDDPAVQYDGTAVGAAARTFLMPDERGSVAGMFYNNSSIRAKNNYDEYGIPGPANQGRFQYTGQAWIPELGMYHYKARVYSPSLGRFLQVDPIGYEGGIALYAYVGNDPTNAVDPTGNCPMLVICRPPAKSITGGPILPPLKKAAPTPENKRANALSTGSQVMGSLGTAQGIIADASNVSASGNGGAGVTALKIFGHSATAIGAGMDAASQMASGKPADQAVVNAGSKAAAATAVGVAVAAAAPESGGTSIALGVVASIGFDLALGKKVGSTAESVWVISRDAVVESLKSGPPPGPGNPCRAMAARLC